MVVDITICVYGDVNSCRVVENSPVVISIPWGRTYLERINDLASLLPLVRMYLRNAVICTHVVWSKRVLFLSA